jgi:hypothetical protein
LGYPRLWTPLYHIYNIRRYFLDIIFINLSPNIISMTIIRSLIILS